MYNYSELKEKVEKAVKDLSFNTEAVRLTDPVKYALSSGGKRLRPVMALMACNLFSDKIDEAILPAIGLEIFHNFTLVHDDIMDQAPVRRTSPTVHTRWNINQAILSGDVMAFIANECILQTPAGYLHKIFTIYNNAAINVCIGQQLDMDYEKRDMITHREYLRMIELKTAVLLAAALKIGAVLGGSDDKNSDLLYEFGRNLGLAFQIQDDLLDIWGDTEVFGKTPGGDIVANKKTFPLVKAMETASGEQLTRLQTLLSLKDADPKTKVEKIMNVYDRLNIKETTEALANEYFEKAFSFLREVGVSEERKKELNLAASSLIGREH
jgi:geranylgeranyl diphosphate synthase type II